jgi:Ser/Thr protein kinase RdoA (MazF antagonist)
MDEQIIIRIAESYGVKFKRLLPSEKGYRNESFPIVTNSGKIINLIIYKREPSIVHIIHNANRTSNFLADHGLPSRHTLDPRIICLSSGSWRKYAGLYNYLPGQTIPWVAYTRQHIRLLGAMLSNLHAELKTLSIDGYPAVAEQYYRLLRAIKEYITQPSVGTAIKSKLGLKINQEYLNNNLLLLKACQRLKYQQVLHMDFVRSNILFESKLSGKSQSNLAICGVLDFEKTAYGHPLFDIARSLAFLLVDCKYKTNQQVRKYFLYSGYQKRGSNRLPHVKLNNSIWSSDLLERLLDIFLTYDFYKFLKHNPYESLIDNEHYQRTRDLLLSRKVIYWIGDTINLN